MKKGDKALSPQITYTGAKTFIIAQVGAVLGMEAYATDTAERGIFDGVVWQWSSITGGGGSSNYTGTFINYEGILKGRVDTLNFVGNVIDVSVSGTVARIFVTGSSSSATDEFFSPFLLMGG